MPIPVGRLHDHIIRLMNVLRIPDQGLVAVSDIAGEHQLPLHAVFLEIDFNGGRAQKMPGVNEANLHAVSQLNFMVIGNTFEMLQYIVGIVQIIGRKNLWQPGSLSLPVLPFRLLHLNVCTVPQHDLRQ